MAHCSAPSTRADPLVLKTAGPRKLALVGQPNVGKSVIFQQLTGQHVAVANYPGTTVEITYAPLKADPGIMVIDTPGIVAFPSVSEDEKVTASVLLESDLTDIVQVADAKNLRRSLVLTRQLLQIGLPMVLVLNMSDEADEQGLAVDFEELRSQMGVPVVPTVATTGTGLPELIREIEAMQLPPAANGYPRPIEDGLAEMASFLPSAAPGPRGLSVLWLHGDPVAVARVAGERADPGCPELVAVRSRMEAALGEPVSDAILEADLEYAHRVAEWASFDQGLDEGGLRAWLDRWTLHPIGGLAFLLLVLAGLYAFVGLLGAGVLVGWLEGIVFDGWINPWLAQAVQQAVGSGLVAQLVMGPYGLWTLGVTYALGLILPIAATFFLAFGVLEDSGYLPRLSVLTNRWFQRIGLNGKAVLPMILGLGCVTMATLSTRILETKRERLMAIILLALAVPCSAQLGVVLGILAGVSFGAVLGWLGVVMVVLFAVGWLSSRLIPGERSSLVIELPPLRLPTLGGLLIKTAARVEWYLKEVVPLFLLGALVMFGLQVAGVLPWLIEAGKPLVTGWLGLPAAASAAFLLGFLRRDFGAAGLFVMQSQGLLRPGQTLVAMVTITLFVPCLASVLMIIRERGWRTAAALVGSIIPLAFLVGGVLHWAIVGLGWW